MEVTHGSNRWGLYNHHVFTTFRSTCHKRLLIFIIKWKSTKDYLDKYVRIKYETKW